MGCSINFYRANVQLDGAPENKIADSLELLHVFVMRV